MSNVVIVMILTLVMSGCALFGADKKSAGEIAGHVLYESGDPVIGATVTLADQTATTDYDGQYSFVGLEKGSYTVSVKAGLFEDTKNATVDGKKVTIDFEMPDRENVVFEKPTTASSHFNNYTGDLVVDGIWDQRASRWLSGRDADIPHTLEIDLEGEFVVESAGVWTGNVNTGSSGNTYSDPVAEFSLQYWDGEWKDIPGGVVQDNERTFLALMFSEPVTTEKIRFYSEDVPPPSPDGYVGIRVREIAIYGLPADE